MNETQLAEVWEMLDRQHLQQIAQQGPTPVLQAELNSSAASSPLLDRLDSASVDRLAYRAMTSGAASSLPPA